MADINDITSWIFRAEWLEKENPEKALGMYEAAERCLTELLLKYGVSIDPEGPYKWAFEKIFNGYKRLNSSEK